MQLKPAVDRIAPGLCVLIFGLFAALGGGCDPVVSLTTDALKNPRDLALACVDNGKAVSLSQCNSSVGDGRLRVYVSSGSQGTIAVGRPHGPEWLDNDPAIPGYTPFLIDGLPQHVTITEADPTHLYATLPVLQQLVRVDIFTGRADAAVHLPFSPGAMVVQTKQARIYVADPAGGSVWWIALDGFGTKSVAQEIRTAGASGSDPIGGSPNSLAWVDYPHDDDGDGQLNDAKFLFVGHLDHGHITVLSLDDLKVVARLPIDAECSDGIDNDGDGQTDWKDSGCDDGQDTTEANPEVGAACSDGIDNDRDGRTDAVDIGCQATPLHDTCRDGIDNDGDGKTDYPADLGCTGYAGRSEFRDNPSCNDGADNDGDGKTDTDDDDCTLASDDTELPVVNTDVVTACSDGIDNDRDGLTDTADSDCPTASSIGEIRPTCDDGIDNDGDGKTDEDDVDCFNRAGASEVGIALAPAAILAPSHNGRFLAVGHRRRQQLLVLDTASLTFLTPLPGTTTPFSRPSTFGTRLLPAGVDLGYTPLAISAVQYAGSDAFAVSLQLLGMVVVRVSKGGPERAIGIVPATDQAQTAAFKPSLVVGGTAVDMSNRVPDRFASFGSLTKRVFDDPDKATDFYGLEMSAAVHEHRTESWRFTYRGQLPGAARTTGRLITSNTLVDPHADFCRLGVVPGDLLLLRRPTGGECEGLKGDIVRYTIDEVGVDSLELRDDGVVDAPVTDDNQKTFVAADLVAVPLPSLKCFARGGLSYEIRANHWLVKSNGRPVATSVARSDGGCEPSTEQLRTDAGRLVEPELAEVDGKAKPLPNCPIQVDDKTDELADHFLRRNYKTAKLEAMGRFANSVLSGRFMPGCKAGADLSEAPRLLPSVRDAVWSYAVVAGFRPQIAKVGVLAVGLASDVNLPYVYAIDQGSSSLRAVGLNDLGVQVTLD